VADLAKSYGSRFVLLGPTPQDLEVLLAAGMVLGWIGAWISATRHLHRIEPRA
jgi:cell division transport system permease protein